MDYTFKRQERVAVVYFSIEVENPYYGEMLSPIYLLNEARLEGLQCYVYLEE